MESLSKLKQHFRLSPTANNGNTIHEAEPDVSPNLAEPNGDLEKPPQNFGVGGIAKLEAAQAVWGRTGKCFLYFGWVLVRSPLDLSRSLVVFNTDFKIRLAMMMIIL
jgi:hypothetical protein